MVITEEMFRKVEDYFVAIDPELLYRDLVENYGLPTAETTCTFDVVPSSSLDGMSSLRDEVVYGKTFNVREQHLKENGNNDEYALAA